MDGNSTILKQFMEKYEQLLKEDLFLNMLRTELDLEKSRMSVNITGGAVVDILRGVKPKDYDILHHTSLENLLRENSKFKLEYVTKSAVTFSFGNSIIQLIYKPPTNFPYTIEKGQYSLTSQKLSNFDSSSFETKLLIPSQNAFEDKHTARCAIQRLLHHQHKGWNLPDITFQSVCQVAFKSDNSKS